MNNQIIGKVLLRSVDPEDKDLDPVKYAFMIGQAWQKQNQEAIRLKVLTGWPKKKEAQKENTTNPDKLCLTEAGLAGLIRDAVALSLRKNKGHKSKTAEDLKITRGTVYDYIKKWPEICQDCY